MMEILIHMELISKNSFSRQTGLLGVCMVIKKVNGKDVGLDGFAYSVWVIPEYECHLPWFYITSYTAGFPLLAILS